MRVAVMTPSGFQIREQPQPDVGPGEILVRTLGCGICEGDLFHYRHRGDKEVVMGHEGTGVVEAVGQDVEGFEPGDVVTALGGRYADYFVAAPRQLLAVPESLDPMLALGEPIACCVHAGGRFGIRLGDRVALVGAGFMGLVCLQLARLQGASFVCALEPIPWRRRMALALGADAAMAPEAKHVLECHGEFDVVIEATGVQGGLDLVGDLVRQHGRVVLVGYHQTEGGQRSVPMQQWNFKAIDVVNGHVRRSDEKWQAMRAGIALLAAGRLDVAPLVSAYPLEEIETAFDDLASRLEGLYKAVLTMA